MTLLWKIRNLPHRLRGWKAELCTYFGVGVLAELHATVVHADGSSTDYGVVSRRVVTNNGVAFLATCFTNAAEPETINFHDAGTGAVAEANGDSALGTPYGGSRATGVQSNPTSNTYKSVGTVAFTSSLAISEHGIFTASSVGTLWDRSVFAAINVISGDTIAFAYTLTITAGG